MKIFKTLLIVLISLTLVPSLLAQSQTEKQDAAVQNFVEAYNEKDYKKIKKDFNLIMKMVLSQKTIAELMEFLYNSYGPFDLKNIEHPANNKAIAQVIAERDPTEPLNIKFTFTKKNKIGGFGLPGAGFKYLDVVKDQEVYKKDIPAKVEAIDKLITYKYKEGNFNGSVLVICDGQSIYENSLGYANFDEKTPLLNEGVFNLASVSKQFTAMGIMILEEQGKLDYSDLIQKHIPEIPKKYKGISIEHLLHHTSGLPDYMDLFDDKWDKSKVATNEDVIHMLAKHKPKKEFKVGKRYKYSNTGYVLLASIIERISGQSFADFMKVNVFDKAGMVRTLVYGYPRGDDETISNYAYGYIYDRETKKYVLPDVKQDFVVYLDGITGDGAVNTTIGDLFYWDKALRSNLLVSEETMKRAHSNKILESGQKTNYGYGVSLYEKIDGFRIVDHSGGWPGFATYLVRFLDKEITIAVLSNNQYTNNQEISDKIIRILFEIEEVRK